MYFLRLRCCGLWSLLQGGLAQIQTLLANGMIVHVLHGWERLHSKSIVIYFPVNKEKKIFFDNL